MAQSNELLVYQQNLRATSTKYYPHLIEKKNTFVLQLFRDNQVFTILFVLLYFLLFGVNIWFYPNDLTSLEELPSTLGTWAMTWLNHPINNKIAFSILLLFQAFIANAIVNNFKLTKHYSYVTAICYILLHFAYPNMDICSPSMLANTFLLWSLYSMCSSYEKRVSLGTIFNIGFAAAVAALFYNGFLIYFFWILAGLFIVRSFDFQEFILLIAGFFIPFFLLGTYHLFNDNLSQWLDQEIFLHYSNMNIHYDNNTALYLLFGILATPLLLAIGNVQGLYFKTTAREKKYINAVLLMPFIAVLSFFFQANIHSYHYIIFILPISILLSITLQSYKSLAAAEMIHFVLFMLCLGIQYQAFFFQ